MVTLFQRRGLIVALLIGIASWGVGWQYLKSPYEPRGATLVASTFMREIAQENWLRAQELTFRNEYTGRTVDELHQISARQICGGVSLISWSPLQSNGNRLRRWLSGTELDQRRVWVEFYDERSICMISVEVRRTAGQQWKVFNFQSHAG